MIDQSASSEQNTDITAMAVDVVMAYVSNNAIQADDLPKFITEVYASILALTHAPKEKEPEPLKPAVPIRKSVTRDHIICLEDGLKYKSIKRHLNVSHNMTPDQYREKWGLPADYPMVAPSYSEQRSKLAKKSGLGRKS